jgi:hypothetical protein
LRWIYEKEIEFIAKKHQQLISELDKYTIAEVM